MEKQYSTRGKLVACDMWGVDFEKLNSISFLYRVGVEAIKRANATLISYQVKRFEPNGVTLLFMLEESHLSFHTYPEDTFVAVDCFTCGAETYPEVAIEYIIEQLEPDPERVYKQIMIRGVE